MKKDNSKNNAKFKSDTSKQLAGSIKTCKNPRYVCNFCDGNHETNNCFYNLDSDNSKLPEKAKKSLKKKGSTPQEKNETWSKVPLGWFVANVSNKEDVDSFCLVSAVLAYSKLTVQFKVQQ